MNTTERAAQRAFGFTILATFRREFKGCAPGAKFVDQLVFATEASARDWATKAKGIEDFRTEAL